MNNKRTRKQVSRYGFETEPQTKKRKVEDNPEPRLYFAAGEGTSSTPLMNT
jgi:hypothetical protein